jgi:hypothetical protein
MPPVSLQGNRKSWRILLAAFTVVLVEEPQLPLAYLGPPPLLHGLE